MLIQRGAWRKEKGFSHMGIFQKISEGLRKTRESFSRRMSMIFGAFTKIDEEFFEELEETLILADVGAKTSEEICKELRRRVKETGATDPQEITGDLEEIIGQMMDGEGELNLSTTPSVILVIGVNGAGKTTSIGKLAAYLKSQGKSVLLGAADTFRAAAIDQLQVWADRAGVEMIRHQEGSDPAAVVFDTLAAAKARNIDVAICDTAGRLHNKKNLMDELSKIARVVSREAPDAAVETLLVIDANTGQNALNQAREFKEAAGLTGIILSKLDSTAKGGVVIAVKRELDVPVKFIGVGEGLDDLQPFDKEEYVRALFLKEQ
ncbi:MAG: signal recognition particle-docking protein FtsY [Oscillospiraceae bacterium]|jgi:fused signal recognition particle receptor|nr:signal recognition particle-docking protein FtsY [Oscillospiraceae bacterium]